MDIFQEVLYDAVNRNIINIQFIPLDEEEQEIEGAFELG
jgi:hypothetical protein